jgi:molybdenum cofactor biosynthesis enzyme MoaA
VEKNCKTLLNADDYKFLVGQCKKMFGWNSVTLTGGEPFVRNDCNEIIKK